MAFNQLAVLVWLDAFDSFKEGAHLVVVVVPSAVVREQDATVHEYERMVGH